MAKATPFKGNFNAGELSPRIDARTDQVKYGGGCSILQNFLPMVQGCLIRRGGAYYMAPVKNSSNRTWLQKFLFNVTSSYVLEFGDLYIRFYTNRGIVSDVTANITGVTQANPAVVTVASSAGLANGKTIYIQSVVGMTRLNNQYYKISGLSGNTFNLVDIFGNTVNSTLFSAYTSGGTASQIYEIVSPYATSDLTDSQGNFRLKFKQSEDVVYICHPSHPVQKLSHIGNTNWTIAPAAIVNGPFQTLNSDKTKNVYLSGVYAQAVTGTADNGSGLIRITVASTTGLATGNTVEVVGVGGTIEANGQWIATVVDATHIDLQNSKFTNAYVSGGNVSGREGTSVVIHASANLFASTDVGALFYIQQPVVNTLTQWQPGLTISNGQRVRAGIYTYIALNGGTSGNITPTHSSGTAYDGSASTGVNWLFEDAGYGILQISAYTNQQQVSATLMVPPPNTNYNSGVQSFLWAYGLFSATNGYPEVVDIFRDRLIFNVGIQQAGSVTSDYLNFSPLINGQVQANSGYVITLPTSNPSRSMSAQNALIVYTAGEEIAVGEVDVSQPLSPTNIQARVQTKHGSRLVDAVQIDFVTMFVSRTGQQLRQSIYNWAINGYMAEEMTTLSEHIPKGPDGKQGIVQMAWQQEPDLLLWGCTTDGRLVCFTYNRDQEVMGWHNHPIGGSDAAAPLAGKGFTNAVVESVCSIPSPDGTQDDVWMVVKRTINGHEMRYVELLQPYFTDVQANIGMAIYMDSALTYAGPPTTIIGGLDHLIGQTVDILLDGAVHPQRTVSATGSITLQSPTKNVAQIGLPCPAVMQSMRIEAGSQLGSAQGATKKIVKIFFRLLNSLGIKFGSPDGTLDEIQFRTASDSMDTPVPLFTGDTNRQDYPYGYETDGIVKVLCDTPLPCTLLGFRAEVDVAETIQ